MKKLHRRTFLGGAAAAVSLPLLESMLPWGSSAIAMENRPTRFLAYYVPNGMHMPAWTPTETGRNFALPPTLQPLANVRDDILVITNLENRPARPDGPGDHAAGTGSFITAVHVRKTDGSDIRNGVSVDQMMTSVTREHTRFASIETGMDGGGSTGNCDSGYSCAYARNISWSGPQTPMPKTVDPRQVFDRLFGGFDPNANAEQIARRRMFQKSILDYTLEDARRLHPLISSNDRVKLDEYMTGIRDLETRIDQMDDQAICGVPDRPESSYDVNGKIRVMTDLMVLAFQCDLTRVQTFMQSNAGSYRSYPWLGVNEGHHQLSHHQMRQDNFDKLMIINRWEMEQFAYLLERLKSTTDPDGTPLLDSCMVFFSSEISDGDRHNHDDLPVIVAGKGNGAIDTGRHLRFGSQQPIANLFVSFLHGMGVEANTFGDDGTGPLPQLT